MTHVQQLGFIVGQTIALYCIFVIIGLQMVEIYMFNIRVTICSQLILRRVISNPFYWKDIEILLFHLMGFKSLTLVAKMNHALFISKIYQLVLKEQHLVFLILQMIILQLVV